MGDKAARDPTPENATLLQGFEWNIPSDSQHYKRLTAHLKQLKSIGVSSIWLPPGCKASSPSGNGYDIYDLWDLGEFNQKGGRPTKWGSIEDLRELATMSDELGIGLYWDAVLNHKAGADRTEKCRAVEVDSNDRNKETSQPYEIEAWVGFDFPGRGDKYSSMKWHWYHFSGTDYNQANGKKAIYKFTDEGKGWSHSVDKEQGNADYMMFADIDYSHAETQEDVKRWGVWITKELGLKGFRLDAVQHFSEHFTAEWVKALRNECGDDIFCVGEFWTGDHQPLCDWLQKMDHRFSLFDAPLLYSFHNASKTVKADLTKILEGSLVKYEPWNAVTCVQNHDTQRGQTVETPVEDWFKPLAYALILLQQGGYPSIFFGDLYGLLGRGSEGKDDFVPAEDPSCAGKLPDLVLARKLFAYGEERDYFESDSPNCVGFVRLGTWDHPAGCAVVMSNAGPGEKRMHVGEVHKGERWTDVLGLEDGGVEIANDGWATFKCQGTSVSVWVNEEADGRQGFPARFDTEFQKAA